MSICSTNSKCALATALVVAFACAVGGAQKPDTVVPWYKPSSERAKVFNKARFYTDVTHPVEHQPGDTATWAPFPTRIFCVWVSFDVARALVAYGIQKEHITSDVAEARVTMLRRPDYYLVLIDIIGEPIGPSGAPINASLIVDKADPVIGHPANIPFTVPFLKNAGPKTQPIAVAFPKRRENGQLIIQSLSDDVVVMLECPGQTVRIRITPSSFVKDLESL